MSWQAIAAAVALVGTGVTAYGQIQAGRRAAGTAAGFDVKQKSGDKGGQL